MDEPSVRSKMQQVIELVLSDVSSVRTGRVTPSIVENIEVFVYGGQQKFKINELATNSASDAQTLLIDPWDKSIIGEIKQGIMGANVGLNPSVDGEVLRLSFPPMTTEDRQKFVKLLHTKIENGKVMIRQIRGDSMKDIKEGFEKKTLSEDEKFGYEKKLQEITDEFVEKIAQIGKNKEEELLQI